MTPFKCGNSKSFSLSKVDKKAIGEMDGVLSVIEKDGLQVVVGPGVCNKLCAAINEILSVDRAASTAAPDAPDVPEEKKKGDFLKIIRSGIKTLCGGFIGFVFSAAE